MGTRGVDAAQRVETAMDRLLQTVQQLSETALHQRPGEGEWTAMENLAHVAELVPFWAHRARKVADGEFAARPYDRSAEENAVRAAAVAEHGRDSQRDMVARLRTSTAEAAATLRGIPDAGWERTAHWAAERVDQSVNELVDLRIIAHVEAHTRQAAAAAQAAEQAP